jgi:uncharacterized protein (TIGR00369 family)
LAEEGEKRPPLSGIETMRGAANGTFPKPPIDRLLGWEPLVIEPGFMRVRYSVGRELDNPMGAVQGGVLAAMLDDAMSPAALTLLGPGYYCPTLEMKVNYIRPAHAHTLVAEGRVVHRTGRYAHIEGRITTEQGELLATASATAAIVAAEINMKDD